MVCHHLGSPSIGTPYIHRQVRRLRTDLKNPETFDVNSFNLWIFSEAVRLFGHKIDAFLKSYYRAEIF